MITKLFTGLIGQAATSIFFMALGIITTFTMVFMLYNGFKKPKSENTGLVVIMSFVVTLLVISSIRALFQINSILPGILYLLTLCCLSALLHKRIMNIYGVETMKKFIVVYSVLILASGLFLSYVQEKDTVKNDFFNCLEKTYNFSDCHSQKEQAESLRRF